MGQKANVNNKVVVLFTTILQGWNGVMSTKNIKKSGKILHKIIGKNRAPRTWFYTDNNDHFGHIRYVQISNRDTYLAEDGI